ncbi:MAG: hypothetical protein IPJ33_03985 [Gammaproteobacteria bacterium]|nr:hypothetical protein [Gammaproteobacteria bacterium]
MDPVEAREMRLFIEGIAEVKPQRIDRIGARQQYHQRGQPDNGGAPAIARNAPTGKPNQAVCI